MKHEANARAELAAARDDLTADLKLLTMLENGHPPSLYRLVNDWREATDVARKKAEESLKRYAAAWTRKEAAGD